MAVVGRTQASSSLRMWVSLWRGMRLAGGWEGLVTTVSNGVIADLSCGLWIGMWELESPWRGCSRAGGGSLFVVFLRQVPRVRVRQWIVQLSASLASLSASWRSIARSPSGCVILRLRWLARRLAVHELELVPRLYPWVLRVSILLVTRYLFLQSSSSHLPLHCSSPLLFLMRSLICQLTRSPSKQWFSEVSPLPTCPFPQSPAPSLGDLSFWFPLTFFLLDFSSRWRLAFFSN